MKSIIKRTITKDTKIILNLLGIIKILYVVIFCVFLKIISIIVVNNINIKNIKKNNRFTSVTKKNKNTSELCFSFSNKDSNNKIKLPSKILHSNQFRV